jgi:hypothetical protein
VAGAYAEDLPVVIIAGGPPTHVLGTNKLIHHALGRSNFGAEMACFKPVTCYQVCALLSLISALTFCKLQGCCFLNCKEDAGNMSLRPQHADQGTSFDELRHETCFVNNLSSHSMLIKGQ